jgi:hypothetical protein
MLAHAKAATHFGVKTVRDPFAGTPARHAKNTKPPSATNPDLTRAKTRILAHHLNRCNLRWNTCSGQCELRGMAAYAAYGTENRDGARFCDSCAARIGGGGRGQGKTVTAIFLARWSGRRRLGEKSDPEAMQGVLTRYFERTHGIIERDGDGEEVHRRDSRRDLRRAGRPRERRAPSRVQIPSLR